MLIAKFSTKGIEERITEFELIKRIKIPEQLKLFLSKYNGGETPNTSFSCEQTSSDIVAFYGMGDVKYSYSSIEVLKLHNLELLPIAFDTFGNDILIDLKSGEIYFRDHENDCCTRIAKDLKTFIKNCNSKLISSNYLMTIQEREQELINDGRGYIITDDLKKLWQNEIDKYKSLKQEEVCF